MENGSTTSQTQAEALAITDRNLRRLVRHVKEANPKPDEDLDKTLRRAQRQLRANRELLGDEPAPGDEPAAGGEGDAA